MSGPKSRLIKVCQLSDLCPATSSWGGFEFASGRDHVPVLELVLETHPLKPSLWCCLLQGLLFLFFLKMESLKLELVMVSRVAK